VLIIAAQHAGGLYQDAFVTSAAEGIRNAPIVLRLPPGVGVGHVTARTAFPNDLVFGGKRLLVFGQFFPAVSAAGFGTVLSGEGRSVFTLGISGIFRALFQVKGKPFRHDVSATPISC
jgi:hypothetical protein